MEDPMLEESCTHRQSSCLSCWLSFPPLKFLCFFFLSLLFALVLCTCSCSYLSTCPCPCMLLFCRCCRCRWWCFFVAAIPWRSFHRFSVARIWKKADDATTVLFTLELLVPQQNGKAWKSRCEMFFLLMTWCFLSLWWIDWTCFWLVWSLDYTTEFLKWNLKIPGGKGETIFGFKMLLFSWDFCPVAALSSPWKPFGAGLTEVRIFEKGGSLWLSESACWVIWFDGTKICENLVENSWRDNKKSK